MAASGDSNSSLLNIGNNVILAGICVQVAQLVAFGMVSVYYAWNVYRHRRGSSVSGRKIPARLNFFMVMVAAAYLFVLIRCVYRYVFLVKGVEQG